MCVMCVVTMWGRVAYAQISINEIMYDLDGTDTDHEWVEIYNGGTDSIDLTDWKFSDGSNHGINIPPENGGQGSIVVGAGEYVVLSPNAPIFLSDHSGYSGTVLDTVMSLTNTTDTISLIDKDGAIADSVTYSSDQGGAGDGNSLSLQNSIWGSATPTPGKENSLSSSSSLNEDTSDNSKDETVVEIPKITADIVLSQPIFSGIKTYFEPKVIGYSGEDRVYGKFEWSMGDGMGRIDQTKTLFDYIYEYPGDYIVTFSYYSNFYTAIPEASKTVIIKVIEPTVLISQVYGDGGIEIKNTTSISVDLSSWKIQSGNLAFIFPNHLSILSNHTIRLSPKVTGFDGESAKNSELVNPSGVVISKYYINNTPSKNVYVKSTKPLIANVENTPLDNLATNPLEAQKASVLDAVPEWLNIKVLYLISVILVGAVLIFITKKNDDTQVSLKQTKDGYEIIE